MHRKHAARLAALVAVPFSSLSCGGGGGGGGGGNPPPQITLSGTIQFVPATSPLIDNEPNDSVDDPQPIGEVRAGQTIVVRGTMGPDERFDAFEILSKERLPMRASLRFEATPERELELALYDPVVMQLVARSDSRHELGFAHKGACDVLVRGVHGSGPYTLTLKAGSPGLAIEAAGHLGTVASHDSIALRGASGARWSFASAESQVVSISVRSSGPAGSLRVLDTSLDGAPVVLAEVASTSVPVAVTLAGLQSLALELVASDPAARFDVDLHSAPAAPAAAPLARARVSSAERERQAWPIAQSEPLFGRTSFEVSAGDVLVRFEGGADPAAALARRGLAVVETIPDTATLAHTELDAALDAEARARTTLALAKSLAGEANVRFAERNLIRRIQGTPVTPTDPHYGLQWHYGLIHLPEAWAIQTGDSAVVVAIIDTGSTAHPDLVARQIGGYDMISNAAVAGDGGGRDADPTDMGDGDGYAPDSWHGTHVAGTIGAATNNGIGGAGVTWATRLMHVRVLGTGGGTDADIAAAIRYAAQLSVSGVPTSAVKADIINMSLGGPGFSQTVQDAVTAAHGAGVAIFAAAGNNNSGTPFYPAADAHVISVSAVDLNAEKAPYSNFHATVDVCAPGGDTAVDLNGDGYVDGVLSTLVDSSTGYYIYAFYQGTSMACPHAAGVAALLLAVDPLLMPDDIESILEGTATDLGVTGRDDIYGHGLINALAAVEEAAGTTSGTPELAVSPTLLEFGAVQTDLTSGVSNVGGGFLQVTGINVATTSGDSWLSAVGLGTTSSSTDTNGVRVTVDRFGLTSGFFDSGTVTVLSNGGTQVIDVRMEVGADFPPVDVDLYVLLVDASTFDTVAQVVRNPATTGLDFVIDETYTGSALPAGDYVLVCGSDDNLPVPDGYICGPGDTYCGLFPTISDPLVITVNEPRTGLDFVVGPAGPTGPAVVGTFHGYRRLR